MEDFPVLQRHMGIWEGTYTLMSSDGSVLDQHQARLEIQRNGSQYFQRNIYSWPDGRRQTIDFPGELRVGRLWFDTPRLSGSAMELDDDTVVLRWHYKDNPEQRLAELIYLVNDRQRCRTWQYIESGQITKLMLINERKIADTVPYRPED